MILKAVALARARPITPCGDAVFYPYLQHNSRRSSERLRRQISLTSGSGSRELFSRMTSRRSGDVPPPRERAPGAGARQHHRGAGAHDIRYLREGYIGLKPHMDVVVHQTTVSGDCALPLAMPRHQYKEASRF